MSDADILRPRVPAAGFNCVIVGLGGVGGRLSREIALVLASVGGDNHRSRMILVDGDSYEATESNAARQFFRQPGKKAEQVRDDISSSFAASRLSLYAVNEYLTLENIGLIREKSIVFCCVDNFATRRMISEYASKLRNLVVISGGNDGVAEKTKDGKQLLGTQGNIQIYVRLDGQDITPDLGKWHPEIATADKLPTDQKSCVELMESGVAQLLCSNLAVASAMVSAFFLLICGRLHAAEAFFDVCELRQQPVLPVENIPAPFVNKSGHS